MAKNYQISQYEIPIGTEGKLKLSNGREIGIIRVHMEEDPAALVHPAGMQESSYVLVDYNRSGDALVEVVTKPELENAEEARDFMNQLITVLKYLEIFDENRCAVKADANISIKESGYIRAEVKNITGFKDIERALKYEIERQKKEVKEGKKLKQETRGWDSSKGITFSLREKETEADYGYIIDPDLVKTEINSDWIDAVKAKMPELAEEKLERFIEKHGVKEEIAKVLSKDRKLAEMFEKVSEKVNSDLASKWVWRELTRVLNFNKKKLEDVDIKPEHMIDLLKLIEEGKITDNVGHKIIEKLVIAPFDVKKYVEKEGLTTIADTSHIEKLCKQAISENPKAVEDYKKGDMKALNFLIGAVMRLTKGKAKPDEVNKIIKELL
jgi:aspartyl-tRNA(Asn)/glutamyl-tRNA(Gln) amidotransferase subunit B